MTVKSNKYITSQKAFSVYEMLITLCLFLALSCLALPMLKNFFSNSNEVLLRENFITGVYFARDEALARHATIGFAKDKMWSQGQLIFLDRNNDGTISDSQQIILSKAMHAPHGEIYWRGFPIHRDYLQFQSEPFLTSTNGTFWHCHASKIMWALSLNKANLIQEKFPDREGKIKDSTGTALNCF